MSAKARRHNLSDWLALHDLDPSLCRQILSAVAGQVGGHTAGQERTSEECTRDPDVPWLRVVDAMCAFFPAQRSIIEDAFDKTAKVLVNYSNRFQRALTLDEGDTGYPIVIYTYYGKAADFMVVAHEFAHALQIVASRGKFVTPIIREVCAFVGEMALLSRLQNTDEAQYLECCQIWHKDDQKYFILDGNKLDTALYNPDTGYRYYWNYPIARYLAIESSKQFPRERMWMLFEGNLSVRQVLQVCGR